MKAYSVNKYKTPIQAGEVAEPTIGDRNVLIDIHAAGINMLDAKIRDGEFKLILPYKPPFILGHDLAGVVTRVGSAVTRFTGGDGDPLGEGADASVAGWISLKLTGDFDLSTVLELQRAWRRFARGARR